MNSSSSASSRHSTLPLIIAVSVMLSLSMGLRQSLGLFMQPLTREIAISVSDFTVAIAAQNLIWGFIQPITGGLAERYGFRPVMVFGAFSYVIGLALLNRATGLIEVILGAGLCIGVSLACTASAMATSVAARAVDAGRRSAMLGIVSAAGSVGALIAAPIGQLLSNAYGWRVGILGFTILAIIMVPMSWIAGRVDRIPVPPSGAGVIEDNTAMEALRRAFSSPPFMVMSGAYFVCGMQLVFLTTHLPSYLDICGMDPLLGAQALGVIGGFNVLGSLFFGWLGGRLSKETLLGLIYISRSVVLGWYFALPPTPVTTLVFAALMGFLWLGVVPLLAGAVGELFGLRWQAMLQGVAFMSHQLGSFMGALGGGIIYDRLGSYDLAWKLGVGIGLVAGLAQVSFALFKPRGPVAA